MPTTVVDLEDTATSVLTGEAVVIEKAMFGAIATSMIQDYAMHYTAFVQSTGVGLIRWPGGTFAEIGQVTSSGRLTLSQQPDGEFGYDLKYPDLIHPRAVATGESVGLTQMIDLAIRQGAALEIILPTTRYTSEPIAAYRDVVDFLTRLFVDKGFGDGRLPERIILDIGNENYEPATYAPVASAILQAFQDFRGDHPNIEFDVALQAMQSGQETLSLLSALGDSEESMGARRLLSEVDVIRVHDLWHSLPSVREIEDGSSKYWALKRMLDAVTSAHARSDHTNAEIDIAFTAFTVTSNDVEYGLVAGLPAAGALLSLFTGMLELGATQAAAWGIAADRAAETSLSFLDHEGRQQISAVGQLYSMMANNLVGLSLVRTATMDADRSGAFNTYAFTSEACHVIYVAANDLVNDRAQVALDLGLDLDGHTIELSFLRAVEGISGVAGLQIRNFEVNGPQITFGFRGDYEVAQIVLKRSDDPGLLAFTGSSAKDFIEWASTLFQIADGRAGKDTVCFAGSDGALHIDLRNGDFSVGERNGSLVSFERVIGTQGPNTIVGSDLANVIFGGRNGDLLNGEGGRDRLVAGSGSDALSGGAGADELVGESGDDTLWGGSGNDVLKGSNGHDVLFGDQGDDTLFGGHGADIFVFGSQFGHDQIFDFAAVDEDRIDLSALVQRGVIDGYADIIDAILVSTAGLVLDFGYAGSLAFGTTDVSDLSEDAFII